jgi:hypothetical protein
MWRWHEGTGSIRREGWAWDRRGGEGGREVDLDVLQEFPEELLLVVDIEDLEEPGELGVRSVLEVFDVLRYDLSAWVRGEGRREGVDRLTMR